MRIFVGVLSNAILIDKNSRFFIGKGLCENEAQMAKTLRKS